MLNPLRCQFHYGVKYCGNCLMRNKIRVVHWRLKNGRLQDDQNVVLLDFIPRVSSERAIKEEFLMIFALVYAAQIQADTIDVIRGMAEDENGTPQLSLGGSNHKLCCLSSGKN